MGKKHPFVVREFVERRSLPISRSSFQSQEQNCMEDSVNVYSLLRSCFNHHRFLLSLPVGNYWLDVCNRFDQIVDDFLSWFLASFFNAFQFDCGIFVGFFFGFLVTRGVLFGRKSANWVNGKRWKTIRKSIILHFEVTHSHSPQSRVENRKRIPQWKSSTEVEKGSDRERYRTIPHSQTSWTLPPSSSYIHQSPSELLILRPWLSLSDLYGITPLVNLPFSHYL